MTEHVLKIHPQFLPSKVLAYIEQEAAEREMTVFVESVLSSHLESALKRRGYKLSGKFPRKNYYIRGKHAKRSNKKTKPI